MFTYITSLDVAEALATCMLVQMLSYYSKYITFGRQKI